LSLSNINNNIITLTTKNAFSKQILDKEYSNIFKNEFSRLLNADVNVCFSIHGKSSEKQTKPIEISHPQQQTGINNNYVFETFVVGAFNKLAFSAAQSLFSDHHWNPVFISGGVGLGKTHLLNAIGNKFAKTYPNKKLKYVTSDEFARDVYSCLSGGGQSIEQLKNDYESYDLLLFDDVQFLSNKEKINEILFHILNNNLLHNKFVVFASDKSPQELGQFNERMKSRFVSGLSIQITKPDLISLKNILENKIKNISDDYHFTSEALDFIIIRNTNDIRQLEGFLHKIFFFVSNFLPPHSIVSLETIKQMNTLSSGGEDTKHKEYDLDPEIIIKQICNIYQVSEDLVKSKERSKQISLVRQVCMYALKQKNPDMSLHQIGACFGGRDHSTVIESIEKIKKIINKNDSLGSFISNFLNKL
jgi:chromosomal replication initiator protein